MIEALWSQLRHRWLYLHSLDSFARLEHLIGTYLIDHNSKIQIMALGGRTPDEVYSGREPDLPERLRGKHAEAQRVRIETNRKVTCSRCSASMCIMRLRDRHRDRVA